MEDLLPKTEFFRNCSDEVASLNTYKIFSSFAYNNLGENWHSTCPLPCQQKNYQFIVRYFHLNSWFDYITNETVPNFIYFNLGYESFIVEVSVETWMYDAGNFLTAIGGNLGLLLGFSCFSMLLGFIRIIQKFKNVFDSFLAKYTCYRKLFELISSKVLSLRY